MSDSLQPSMDLAHQAPLSMGFSKQEYWSGLPCPPPGDLPNPGIRSGSPALEADALPSEPPGGEEGESKGERAVQAVINSLCAHQSLEHPERFMESHREEKRKERDRDDQEEKRGSKGERPI